MEVPCHLPAPPPGNIAPSHRITIKLHQYGFRVQSNSYNYSQIIIKTHPLFPDSCEHSTDERFKNLATSEHRSPENSHDPPEVTSDTGSAEKRGGSESIGSTGEGRGKLRNSSVSEGRSKLSKLKSKSSRSSTASKGPAKASEEKKVRSRGGIGRASNSSAAGSLGFVGVGSGGDGLGIVGWGLSGGLSNWVEF